MLEYSQTLKQQPIHLWVSMTRMTTSAWILLKAKGDVCTLLLKQKESPVCLEQTVQENTLN